MTQARQENYRGRSSEQQEVDDEVSSFEEVDVQKKLVKEGKIEVVEHPRYMTGEAEGAGVGEGEADAAGVERGVDVNVKSKA